MKPIPNKTRKGEKTKYQFRISAKADEKEKINFGTILTHKTYIKTVFRDR